MTVLAGSAFSPSPPLREPVSPKRYAAFHGKGFLALETGAGSRRPGPKSSVSVGLLVRSKRACLGYIAEIQGDRKFCHIKGLRGGGRSPSKPVCEAAAPDIATFPVQKHEFCAPHRAENRMLTVPCQNVTRFWVSGAYQVRVTRFAGEILGVAVERLRTGCRPRVRLQGALQSRGGRA